MARPVFDAPKTPDEKTETGTSRAPIAPRRKPIIKGGAASDKYIKAATQGGADRTYQEIAVNQIADSKIRDRIDINEDLQSLMDSIRENGQQIPILVRAITGDQPYEIVVGRRRLAATRRLGMPRIKAFVSKMDDREAFVAQGIENSARLETSYIERARAAAQGLEAGYEQKDIAEFLNVSRTLINFMVKAYTTLGEDLVVAIGPARGVGRRQWDKLITGMETHKITPSAALSLIDIEIEDSVERFQNLLKSVQAGGKRKAPAKPAKTDAQRAYMGGNVTTVRKDNQIVIKTKKSTPPALLDRLAERIDAVIREHEESQSKGGA
ncbi:ParB/RepB/Spo0J family partition protein [Leisingera caerulea]|uniref:ParB/RepB/Spo0J family partition protein n=1 Tax=Leisingera caerulea TaxID=506591 RepID=UPI0004269DB7|nr:ParB/RepB/Spo0J family partition protein [Leisingera caerulea]